MIKRWICGGFFLIMLFGLWGCNSGSDPTHGDPPTPPPNNGPVFTAVAGGFAHTLALTSTGKLYVWGANSNGQLGNGSTTDSHIPLEITVPAGVTFSKLAAGEIHSVAVTTTGLVYVWGGNQFGQLGLGDTAERHTPTLIPGLDHVTAISARHYHTLALKDDGTVWAWGYNDHGQVGNNSTVDQWTPVQVKGPGNVGVLTGIREIATGRDHSVALATDDTIYAWGGDAFGQLGDGYLVDSHFPTHVKTPIASAAIPLGNIKSIAAGTWHTLGIKKTGEIYAWGSNAHGQLAQPNTVDHNALPVQITALSGVTALDAGWNYSTVILSTGKIAGWGNNDNGELGIGGAGDQYGPVYTHLPGGVTVQSFTAGCGHQIIITPNGMLYLWGMNGFGQLGNGSTTNCLEPITINF